MRSARPVIAALALVWAAGAPAMTADFRPEPTELRLQPRTLRPGDTLTVSLTFVNRGRKATDLAYAHLNVERGDDQPSLF